MERAGEEEEEKKMKSLKSPEGIDSRQSEALWQKKREREGELNVRFGGVIIKASIGVMKKIV